MRRSRGITSVVTRQLARRAAVVVTGAPGTGRTSLLGDLQGQGVVHTVLPMSDPGLAGAAAHSPAAFADALVPGVAVDDADLVPGLVEALLASAMEIGRPGRFVLTTAAPVAAGIEPTGQVDVLLLGPVTRGERIGQPGSGLLALWHGVDVTRPLLDARAAGQLAAGLDGGLPAAWSAPERARCYRAHLDHCLVAVARGVGAPSVGTLDAVVRYVCRRSGQWTSPVQIAWDLEVDPGLVDAALRSLEAGRLVRWIPARGAAGGADQRRGRWVVADPGFVGAELAMGGNAVDLGALDGDARLALVRTMVCHEVLTQNEWRRTPLQVTTWRSPAGTGGCRAEVDLVLEDAGGRLLPVVVASSEELADEHVDALAAFERSRPSQCLPGVVLHPADRISGLRGGRVALPLSALWSDVATTAGGDVGSLESELREAVAAVSLLASAPRRRACALAEDRRRARRWLDELVTPRLETIGRSLRAAGLGCDLAGSSTLPHDRAAEAACDGEVEKAPPERVALAIVAPRAEGTAPAGRPDPLGGWSWWALVSIDVDQFGRGHWTASHCDARGDRLVPGDRGAVDGLEQLDEALADAVVAHLVSRLPDVVQLVTRAGSRRGA